MSTTKPYEGIKTVNFLLADRIFHETKTCSALTVNILCVGGLRYIFLQMHLYGDCTNSVYDFVRSNILPYIVCNLK